MEYTDEIKSAMISFLTVTKLLEVQARQTDLIRLSEELKCDEGEMLILHFSKYYKLKSKLCVLDTHKAIVKKTITMPVIAKSKSNNFFIIAKIENDKAIVLFHDKAAPEIIKTEELLEIWDGVAVFIGKKSSETAEAFFSFKWFIPTIIKFKREFFLVLLAAFVIQILGIMTPLMIQVVVDKVLSHHTLSTLNTLMLGIMLVYIFELLIIMAKNYLFTHTTNRVDVMLSSKLFKHLFSLPLRYFETRRAGETVARVRELTP